MEGEGEFIRHLDNDWGIAVFAIKSMLEELSMVQTLYFGGTFRTAPKPYHQFVTVHKLVHGFAIPLVFCLATGNNTGQYRQLIQCMKHAVRRLTECNLAPDKVATDF